MKTRNTFRTLPLPAMLKDVFLRLRESRPAFLRNLGLPDTPFVFLNTIGNPIQPGRCSKTFERAVAKVGLQGMRLHDLRHTVVSYLLEAGENPKTIQEFVGHADANFTVRQYAHALDKTKLRASETLMRTLFLQETEKE